MSQLSQVLLVYGTDIIHQKKVQAVMSYSTDKPMAKLCPRGCMTDNLPSIIIRATTNSREKEQNTAGSLEEWGKTVVE